MKTSVFFLAAGVFSILIPVTCLNALSYVESSSGLVPPSLDGGRTEIEMADINQDGNIDLLSIGDHGSPYINTDQHGIMVWFGDGTGSWSVSMNGDFGYGGIAIGDVNRDGYLDVGYAMHHNYASGDFGDQLIEVALGNGSGESWQPWDDSLAMEGQDWGMFGTDFCDFNNDGRLDICSNAFGYDDGVHVYTNNNNGTWHYVYGFIGGNSTMDIACGDVNNDGNADFAASHQGGTVYIGDGAGNFTVGDGNLPPGGTMGLYGVSLRDVNGDGSDELAFCNSNGGVEVWSWTGTNTWQSLSGTLPATDAYELAQLFDMNTDGYCDIAAFGNGTVTVWLRDSSGNWTEGTNFSTPSPGDAEAFRTGGDADHNGFPDIALVSDEGSWPNYRNHLHFYREATTPGTTAIHPIDPHGHEKFFAGSVHFLDWISTISDSSAAIDLWLSVSGISGPWHMIDQDLPDNGRYQWHIPDTLASQDCFIKYVMIAGPDTAETTTPSAFEILGSASAPEGSAREYLRRQSLSVIPTITTRQATCHYHTGNPGAVCLRVYDITGSSIRKLLDVRNAPPYATVSWDCTNEKGIPVQNGVYFIQLKTEHGLITEKLTVIR